MNMAGLILVNVATMFYKRSTLFDHAKQGNSGMVDLDTKIPTTGRK